MSINNNFNFFLNIIIVQLIKMFSPKNNRLTWINIYIMLLSCTFIMLFFFLSSFHQPSHQLYYPALSHFCYYFPYCKKNSKNPTFIYNLQKHIYSFYLFSRLFITNFIKIEIGQDEFLQIILNIYNIRDLIGIKKRNDRKKIKDGREDKVAFWLLMV